MVVFVCASGLLPSRTDFPANLPVSDRRAEPTEANIVKSINISRIRRIPRRRTQTAYLRCLQQFSREKGPFFGEMCVSRCGWAGEPTEANIVKSIPISRIRRIPRRRTQADYLHCLQQFSREKGRFLARCVCHAAAGKANPPKPTRTTRLGSAYYSKVSWGEASRAISIGVSSLTTKKGRFLERCMCPGHSIADSGDPRFSLLIARWRRHGQATHARGARPVKWIYQRS